jgi:hypothetical protein
MPIRLLSTDFDGTLIGHQPDARTAKSLFGALTSLRRSGAVWAINTGRQLWFALEGLEQAHLPHDPEYVLSSEKDIYRRVEEGSWLLLVETLNGVEMPWTVLQKARPQAVVRLSEG